jgi:7-cyano-7-deazaguanine synthase in queuosine biosynthesis
MVTYMGINRMAPDEIRPFPQKLIIDYGWTPIGKVFSAPFLFLHKPQILDIIYQLGCEDLIPYTRSCNVQSDDPCGECYSCAERKWGFDALGKTDPGTILPEID